MSAPRYRSNWDDEPEPTHTKPVPRGAETQVSLGSDPEMIAGKGNPLIPSQVIGAAFVKERRRCGWSQAVMAAQLGLSMGTYRRLEAGRGITMRLLEKACEVLGWKLIVETR